MKFLLSSKRDVFHIRYVRSELHHVPSEIAIFIKHYASAAGDTNRPNLHILEVRHCFARPIALLMPMKVFVIVKTNPLALILCGCQAGRRQQDETRGENTED